MIAGDCDSENKIWIQQKSISKFFKSYAIIQRKNVSKKSEKIGMVSNSVYFPYLSKSENTWFTKENDGETDEPTHFTVKGCGEKLQW